MTRYGPAGREDKPTFDTLDLLGTKAGEGTAVLGTRDASGADGSLDIHDRSAGGRPALTRGKLLRSHDLKAEERKTTAVGR